MHECYWLRKKLETSSHVRTHTTTHKHTRTYASQSWRQRQQQQQWEEDVEFTFTQKCSPITHRHAHKSEIDRHKQTNGNSTHTHTQTYTRPLYIAPYSERDSTCKLGSFGDRSAPKLSHVQQDDNIGNWLTEGVSPASPHCEPNSAVRCERLYKRRRPPCGDQFLLNLTDFSRIMLRYVLHDIPSTFLVHILLLTLVISSGSADSVEVTVSSSFASMTLL